MKPDISEFSTIPIESIWRDYDANYAGDEGTLAYLYGDWESGIVIVCDCGLWWAESFDNYDVEADGSGDSPAAALASLMESRQED